MKRRHLVDQKGPKMTAPTLRVRNIEQAAAWLELDGQLSDGFWENSRPYDHWRPWCDAKIVIDPKNVGRNFYASKSNYNFTAKELIDVVGLRMLAIVRIARALGLDVAAQLEHAPDCVDGRIDWSASWNQDRAVKIAEVLGIYPIEVKNRVDIALADESYTMTDLRRDLNDLKTIVKSYATQPAGVI